MSFSFPTSELQRLIERQVQDGWAASPAAFLEAAVRRMIDEANLEDADIHRVVEAALADVEAGRYTLVATPEDRHALHHRIMERLRANLGNA